MNLIVLLIILALIVIAYFVHRYGVKAVKAYIRAEFDALHARLDEDVAHLAGKAPPSSPTVTAASRPPDPSAPAS